MSYDFTDLFTFFIDNISYLLMKEPFIYFTGALLSLFVLSLLKRLLHIN